MNCYARNVDSTDRKSTSISINQYFTKMIAGAVF